jgi:hypothetical protein
VFVDETVICVVAFAVPSTLVGDVKRPLTVAVDALRFVVSEKLPSVSIVVGPATETRTELAIVVPTHGVLTRKRKPPNVRPPSCTSRRTSSRCDVSPPKRPGCASGGGGGMLTTPV